MTPQETETQSQPQSPSVLDIVQHLGLYIHDIHNDVSSFLKRKGMSEQVFQGLSNSKTQRLNRQNQTLFSSIKKKEF